jgi:enoyl-CoA hydratase/carnithine racemase
MPGTRSQHADAVDWTWAADGIVDVVFDDPGRRVNTVNPRYRAGMDALLDALEQQRDRLRGVVLTSTKRSFFSGNEIGPFDMTEEDVAAASQIALPVKDQLRRLEQLHRPVVAVMTGSAVGFGLEIALATHHRIALDTPDTVFSLAEVTMGLLPGGGGLVRATRLLGVARGFLDLFGTGRLLSAQDALRIGLIDDIAPTRDAAVHAARTWIDGWSQAGHTDITQRWERDGYRIPGGVKGSPELDRTLPQLVEHIRQTNGLTPARAPEEILAAAVDTTELPIDGALAEERRRQLTLLADPLTPTMSKYAFADVRAVRDGLYRPAGDTLRIDHVHLIGDSPTASMLRFRVRGHGVRVTSTAVPAVSSPCDVILDARSASERAQQPAEVGLAGLLLDVDDVAATDGAGLGTPATRPRILVSTGRDADYAEIKAGDHDVRRQAHDVACALGLIPFTTRQDAAPLAGLLRQAFSAEVDRLRDEGYHAPGIALAAQRSGFGVHPLSESSVLTPEAGSGSSGNDDDTSGKYVRDRLLLAIANAAADAVEREVVTTTHEADVAALLVVGYPTWTGGPTAYLRTIKQTV